MEITDRTIDQHHFEDDCDDCGSMCAGALEELLAWITSGQRHRKPAIGKIAALFVVTRRMTAVEASAKFRVSKMTINRHRDQLEAFGVTVKRGKVI